MPEAAPFCGMGVCFQCCDAERVRTCLPRAADAPTANQETDVLIVGAGPAGIAAAHAAAGRGFPTLMVDENAGPGGQIWRGEKRRLPDTARLLTLTTIAGFPTANALLAERAGHPFLIHYRRLILATGARERWLPFPGWTLPHVTGAGGLQALVKGGLDIAGQRVIVAGTGPLLLAVASYLRTRGAAIAAIVEQAPAARVNRFAATLALSPARLAQAALLRARLLGVPYLTGAWIEETNQSQTTIDHRGRKLRIPADRVATGFGLVPNVELARLLGCAVEANAVAVDSNQRTSVANVWCAGEAAGIGGVDAAAIEGRIAGFAAAGHLEAVRELHPHRDRAHRFARRLEETFRLRQELLAVPTPETVVCRCENVPLGRIREHDSWREAKLMTRCGMGPCQGRVCGPAVEALLGWRDASARPPVLPVSVAALAANTNTTEDPAR
ncbi:MAG: FAD/NAD(P)-binding oxidoreductase [Bryobacteraceae bacterium]